LASWRCLECPRMSPLWGKGEMPNDLPPRAIHIALLVSQGRTVGEIAESLKIHRKTVSRLKGSALRQARARAVTRRSVGRQIFPDRVHRHTRRLRDRAQALALTYQDSPGPDPALTFDELYVNASLIVRGVGVEIHLSL
jgi:hypothetical protein